MKNNFSLDALNTIFSLITENANLTYIHTKLKEAQLYDKSYVTFRNSFNVNFKKIHENDNITYLYTGEIPFSLIDQSDISNNENLDKAKKYINFINKWEGLIQSKLEIDYIRQFISQYDVDNDFLSDPNNTNLPEPKIIEILKTSSTEDTLKSVSEVDLIDEESLKHNINGVLFKLNRLEDKIKKMDTLIQDLYSQNSYEKEVLKKIIQSVAKVLDDGEVSSSK